MPRADSSVHQQSRRLGWHLRRYFVAGLVTLFPIVATCYVMVLLFAFADNTLGRPANHFLQTTVGWHIPGLGAVFTVLCIAIVGVISAHLMVRGLFQVIDVWLTRIPFISGVYTFMRRFTTAVLMDQPQQAAVYRGVFIEYPRPGCYAIALVTNELRLRGAGGERTWLVLLVAHAHSPFTSPMLVLPKEVVVPIDLTLEEVLKVAVSGGILLPRLQAAEW